MLLKYIVRNFKSIADPLEFSMIPTDTNIKEPYIKKIHAENTELNVLRRGMFFGANASGKTSFVDSIYFAREFITEGQKSGRRIKIEPFKGAEEEPSLFQFVFLLNNNVFEYGFSLDHQKVHEEWLLLMKNNDFISVFERVTNDQNETSIQIEQTELFEPGELQLAEVLKSSIKEQQKNQLFLIKMSENGISLAEHVVDWFRSIIVVSPESNFRGLEMQIATNKGFAEFLSSMLGVFDTGVTKVKSMPRKFPLKKLLEEIDVPQEVIDELYEKRSGVVEINGKMFLFSDSSGEPILYELKLEHRLKGAPYTFDKDEESDGTKRLLDLLPILYQLSDKKHVYVIDELDRSVHTLVTKEFLKRFLVSSQATQNQLLITAHDVNLIDLSEVSAQEVWFFDKNHEGVTSIKPLSNFNLEAGYNADLAYLAGRFGGIPTIRGGA